MIPVISFLVLRGKCRYCQKPISWQYPAVELAVAGLLLLVPWSSQQAALDPLGVAYALGAGLLVYGIIKRVTGLRLTEEQEMRGADLSIHKIGANPESDIRGL